MKKLLKHKYAWLGFLIAFIVVVGYLSISPTNTADWTLDQQVLPYARISENLVTVENVRNFDYTSVSDYVTAYYTKTYDMSKIKSVDYIIEPFGDFSGAAHTFLSFGFEGGQYVSTRFPAVSAAGPCRKV